ncbi:MAG: zinc-ribbon domain-containing protein [Methanobacterium sp.]|jgi:hypothetical protein|nr:MAG: zinc-ribbon domain-containing protein [Methanobacterium sp.]
MGYLICGKCKSYYKLQPGESADDFIDRCNCGGKLRYAENIDIVNPDWKEAPISDICPKCGDKNPKGAIFCNNCGIQIQNYQNDSQTNRTSQSNRNKDQLETGFIKSIKNELNFDHINWTYVIPASLAIALMMMVPSGFFLIFIFIVLIVVGFLFKDKTIGTKNAFVTGAISFFLGSLVSGSFFYLIPVTILGAILGAIFGWIGGFIKTKI